MGCGLIPWIQVGLSITLSDSESLLCPGMESILDRSELMDILNGSRDGFNPESLRVARHGFHIQGIPWILFAPVLSISST